jgi:hypothetical protein
MKKNTAKEAAIISLDWLLRLARIARAPESSYVAGKPLLPFLSLLALQKNCYSFIRCGLYHGTD